MSRQTQLVGVLGDFVANDTVPHVSNGSARAVDHAFTGPARLIGHAFSRMTRAEQQPCGHRREQ